MNRTKVLFAIPALDGGGAERVFLHLHNNLDRDAFEVSLAIGVQRGPLLRDLRDDIKVFALTPDAPDADSLHAQAGARPEKSPRALMALRGVIAKQKPDVVFSTIYYNFFVAALKPFLPRRTRLVLREGASASPMLKRLAERSPARARVIGKLYRTLYRRADTVVCQSEWMRRDLSENMALPPQKTVVIHNPLDLEKLDTLAAAPSPFQNSSGPHLVAAGRLLPLKGYDVLIRAFAALREKHPQNYSSATLSILGEGPEKETLQNLARELKIESSVNLAGFQANPYAFIAHADLFVSSSRYESFSNVLLEALACGTRVVATDGPGGNREIVQHGENGWLCPVGDADALAHALDNALHCPTTLDATQIRAQCEERYALPRIVAAYEAQLKSTPD